MRRISFRMHPTTAAGTIIGDAAFAAVPEPASAAIILSATQCC